MAGLAAMSPSPVAAGWLPVQNVMPPSEAINTTRSYSRTLRAVHGATTSSAPAATTTAATICRRDEEIHAEQQQVEQVRRARERGDAAENAAQQQ